MDLLKQAARAERLARSVMDAYATDALMRYARECRELAARSAEVSTSPTLRVAISNTARSEDMGRQLAPLVAVRPRRCSEVKPSQAST